MSTFTTFDFSGKKVLVRVDFNVPLDKAYHITDDTRMRAALKTINYILDGGGAVILFSHLGRPEAKLKADGSIDKEKFTLRHLAPHLAELLKRPVQFCDDLRGDKLKSTAEKLQPGEVLLLENTRFEPGEEKCDPELSKEWAALADMYINDAFGTAHRAHASNVGVSNCFPADKKSFGFLMDAELSNARKLMRDPQRPFTAIIGGAKVSDKILLIETFLDIADQILIGGGMAYTFIKALDGKIGNSLVELDKVDLAKSLLEKAQAKGKLLLLPVDSIIADAFADSAQNQICNSNEIPDGWMGLDIGPIAREQYKAVLVKSKTILWNGPMGVFEMPSFAKGTLAVANAVAESTKEGAYSLIGGGDSVAAINQAGLDDEVSYVSTGGGAMLELLEGKDLPGVKAIEG
ncbi:MAG: phosphoglycerate kinase [Saprospiraceae bacterium]|jgi:phosphoglycerate kinase|nr:phosphoglycerate kinase [Saprospiraceae bacterium]MBK8512096.1 phosphoglycerate kinase [Saprospiraceae bacterium]